MSTMTVSHKVYTPVLLLPLVTSSMGRKGKLNIYLFVSAGPNVVSDQNFVDDNHSGVFADQQILEIRKVDPGLKVLKVVT